MLGPAPGSDGQWIWWPTAQFPKKMRNLEQFSRLRSAHLAATAVDFDGANDRPRGSLERERSRGHFSSVND